jgi:ABC-type branched-subunit amino acid transport system ATPase component
LLEIKKMSKFYDGIRVISHLSVSFFKKEKIVGIFGSNGCGKTTLLDCIGGFTNYSGEIIFNGQSLQKSPLLVSRAGIQRTFQRPKIFPSLSVEEHAKISNSSTLDLFKELLPQVDVKKKAGSLSFGQQKILELAVVESQNPKLILFDEPFAGIHKNLSEKIYSHMCSKDYCSIIIEHDIFSLRNSADVVYEMIDGKLNKE